ncbi:hypothetical protein FRX31_020903 [Thalictrum thalictroides]|uniref:Uncharacterized protein n=1 Tax=Thalictrum thalictroides TaxID=46969 RepID=A0A7J6VZB0_THATH|nr:hypothetical protein FRX31_020903 [Thalictrum thalictroides]
MKNLKGKLRVWNNEVFGKVDRVIEGKVAAIQDFDIKAESDDLNDEEETYRAILKQEVLKLERRKEESGGLWRAIMKNWPRFKEEVSCKIGMGSKTLKNKFPRLYSVSILKDGLVADMVMNNEKGRLWNLHLRRDIFEWEKHEIDRLTTMLDSVEFEEGANLWRWLWSKNGEFNVKSMYKDLFKDTRDDSAYT